MKIVLAILGIICLFLRKKKSQILSYLDDLESMLDDYFYDVDLEKKNYRGDWSSVENWKKVMHDQADCLKKLYEKEGKSESVLKVFDKLGGDLNKGLRRVQKGKSPLVAKKLKVEN